MKDILFTETQRFRSWWMWLIILPLLLSPSLTCFFWTYREPETQKPLPFLVICLISLLIACLIFFLKLETRISISSVSYRFSPFQLKFKTIETGDIHNIQVREYSPVAEYGGYGFRYSFYYGKALNVSGRYGIQIELKNGKKILIGTQKPEEAEQILQTIHISEL